ncbi:hypothetical protein CBS147343_3894 [Aspergillus niger]|nr:hypothetical protein CBS133816_2545 [Aspergillus niger]KAI2865487.1 hypothetical protein CBS12448_2117 [Aspergillus niger]KAI2920797.1 hypothetical protein CBS147371_3069 [Aspergillus niger]KAI2927647.1 hypothetical protein CBS147320_4952 [Aspergillus niger]KAI2948147.1 hypothetical protein CBS147321_2689 [Aspergillus niger]
MLSLSPPIIISQFKIIPIDDSFTSVSFILLNTLLVFPPTPQYPWSDLHFCPYQGFLTDKAFTLDLPVFLIGPPTTRRFQTLRHALPVYF